MGARVRLFSKKEIQKRLNEAQTLASVNADIQQVQMQINQAEQDYMKRIEPLRKKLIELQAQQSNLQGQQASQTQVTQPGTVAMQKPGATQPQGGVQASPGATTV